MAEGREVERRVWSMLASEDVEDIDDPIGEFERVVAEARAFQVMLQQRIGGLEQERWRYRSDQGTEQLRSEVALYERAIDRTAKLLADWQRLGFEERKTRLEERSARAAVEAVVRALDDPQAELTDGQREALRAAVAREFRALGGGEA